MITFQHDDPGYLEWLKKHPAGYVLNVREAPDPQYVVLHRAACKTISRDLPNAGGYTGRGYRKVVATTKEALETAAVQQGRADGTFSRECALCRP